MAAAAQIIKPVQPLDEVAPGLFWCEVYWMDGDNPTKGGERSEIRTGVPYLGWGRCLVIDKDPTNKMVTLFCPHTYEGFQVSRLSFEYKSLRRPTGYNRELREVSYPEFDRDWHVKNMYAKWDEALRYNWQRDFDTAVVVMRLLGMDVPTMMPEGVKQKVSGGKEADVLGLLKPVKRQSKVGKVLAYFWPSTGKSVRECMVDMSMTRSNVLSNLYLLNKNHGIAYVLQGDQAIITMPSGCEDPYAPE
jgi:hypothetical protein